MDVQAGEEGARRRAPGGERVAVDRIFPLVYQDLRSIAAGQIRRRSGGDGLEGGDLVHETYLRFADQKRVPEQSRAHFLSLAVHIMRRILLDQARRHGAAKRGGRLRRVPLREDLCAVEAREETRLEVDEALERLARLEPRLARVVDCRFFEGLTEEETAEALHLTARTVRRDWLRARSWLGRALGPEARVE